MRNWLENWRVRIEVWWFDLRAVELRIVRACGHVEEGKVLPEWIEGRRNSECPECQFRDALERMKAAGKQ